MNKRISSDICNCDEIKEHIKDSHEKLRISSSKCKHPKDYLSTYYCPCVYCHTCEKLIRKCRGKREGKREECDYGE